MFLVKVAVPDINVSGSGHGTHFDRSEWIRLTRHSWLTSLLTLPVAEMVVRMSNG